MGTFFTLSGSQLRKTRMQILHNEYSGGVNRIKHHALTHKDVAPFKNPDYVKEIFTTFLEELRKRIVRMMRTTKLSDLMEVIRER